VCRGSQQGGTIKSNISAATRNRFALTTIWTILLMVGVLIYALAQVCDSVCVCVCVCEGERERERESVCVCVC